MKWAKYLNRNLTKRTFRWQINITECSTSYVFKEMKIKTIIYYYTFTRVFKIQTTDTTKGRLLVETQNDKQLWKKIWQVLTKTNILLLFINHTPWYLAKKMKMYLFKIMHSTGKTQRDGVGREVGAGIRMGNTCKSMADSCQCMAKTTTIL